MNGHPTPSRKKQLSLLFEQAQYLQSASKLSQCPDDTGSEVAFAGRSNAGKSSAINALTGNRKLARTSKTPGRTQLINFFSMNEQQRLVDLPGHGYAKVPMSVRDHWRKHLDIYLRKRSSLAGVVLVVDIRRSLQEFDHTMLEWANKASMPTLVLLSKADKLKYGAAKSTLLSIEKELKNHSRVSVQLFSSLKHTGIKEAQKMIVRWLTEEGETGELP